MKKNRRTKTAVLFSLFMLFIVSNSSFLQADPIYQSNNLEISVTHVDETTIHLVMNVSEYVYDTIDADGTSYALIDVLDAGKTSYKGQATLPMIRKMIEIPYGSTPVITVNDVQWQSSSLEQHQLPERIYPVQSFVDKIDTENPFVIDDDYYQTDQFFPAEPVIISETSMIRNRRFIILEIAPVLYNPAQGDLELMISCDLTIDVADGFNAEKTVESMQRYSSDSFEEVYNQVFENYGYYEQFISDSKNPEEYLIITDDVFQEEIAPFASWKQTVGFNVTVTLTSDISDEVTAADIQSYIETAYDTWVIPPSYILLVGDTDQIPAFSANGGVTDTPFVTMDSDSFQDIYIGRFPASTEQHVTTMVEKTLYYEQGDFSSYDWIKKAAFLASVDNYDISEGTHNYVIDTHLEPNGYTCDKLYQVSYDATTQDVRDAINDGRSLVIFSGHGSMLSWSDGPHFTQSDVYGLTNDGMYPFVCSHACLTGKFSVGECFGETWLRAQNKGGIAFWGSSINTQWDPDDIIERRVFDAWWNDNMGRIGQMTDKGMYDAYMEYGSGMDQFIKSYNVLGDASVTIWRDTAAAYDVYQDMYDRGFPIRHALDGDWAAAQSFQPKYDTLSAVDLYLRKFGSPEFDLTVELREGSPQGTLVDTIVFASSSIESSWGWVTVDIDDIVPVEGVDYFIVIPPAPSGVTTSFGYEWGYALDDVYPDGSFWFTRDGGGLWRDLPDSYEFTFRTY